MADAGASTRTAVHSALRVLLGVSGADSVSLWSDGEDGPRLIAAVGDAEPTLEELRQITGGGDPNGAPVSTVSVEVPGGRPALLIARDAARPRDAHEPLLRTARAALASLLRGRSEPAESTAAAAERRLNRLRYDLHDGPQQEVHLLAQDLRLFREQLTPMLGDHPDRDRALGRLDDLEAQLIALDEGLRRLSSTARSPLLEPGSLAQALAAVTEAFTARAGIVPRTEISGDIDSLTDSQRIALVSLVREALANVRRHADAERVTITIAADENAITVEIEDDGAGFDPAVEGLRAAREGHLGLIGMRERMRMLGGDTRFSSTPGGPTTVAASLPRWPVEPTAA